MIFDFSFFYWKLEIKGTSIKNFNSQMSIAVKLRDVTGVDFTTWSFV